MQGKTKNTPGPRGLPDLMFKEKKQYDAELRTYHSENSKYPIPQASHTENNSSFILGNYFEAETHCNRERNYEKYYREHRNNSLHEGSNVLSCLIENQIHFTDLECLIQSNRNVDAPKNFPCPKFID